MNIKKDGEEYAVESSSRKGKWYKVDPDKPWCDCPAYKFKYLKSKQLCKHIKSVREYIEKKEQKTLVKEQENTDEILAFIEAKGGEIDSVDLMEIFGDDKVERLIKLGEIIEQKGKIKILK